MTHTKTSIIIAESKELFRKGLVALLKTKSDLEILKEATTGPELLEQLKQTVPDIVLMEATLPLMNSKTVLEIIHHHFPDLRVIVLSEQPNAQLQSDLMARGANGFLSKDCDIETLYQAIHKVRTEGFFFDSTDSKAFLPAVLKEETLSALDLKNTKLPASNVTDPEPFFCPAY